MAATIKIKNSSTAGAAPTSSDLVQGELAVNVTDKRLFTENSGGTVVELGTNPSSIALPDGSASAPTLLHSGDTNTGLFFPAADTIALTTGGTERLRLDSSGNLGLGVTPSAWSSTYKAIDSSTTGAFVASSSQGTDMWYNAYASSGGNVYKTNGYASVFRLLNAGGFAWFNAASGTAGGTPSFTQAMTLDASGNLGIGTTSPTQKLQVAGKIAVSGTNPSIQQIVQNAYLDLCGGTTVGTDPSIQIAGSTTTSDANKIFYNSNTHVFRSSSGGTTYSTIDSSGNLLVGTTTSDARVRASGTGTVGRFVADGGSYTGNIISADTTGTAAGTGFNLILLQAGGANQFRVRGDGTIYAQNTSVQSISDVRIKENIVDSTDGLAVVTALRPVRFDFKEKFGNNRKNQLGFIAQEVEAVFPDAVDVWGESDDSNDPYKSVGAGALIPVLVKAIQEQQAIIESLTARITALEAA